MSCGVDQLGENCASDYLKTLNCKLRQSRKVSSRSQGQGRLKSCCFLGTEFQFKLVKTVLNYCLPEV